jgi:large subunit ribosomal protein L13
MTTKTVRMKASQITKDWHVIDAANRPLGRLASEVATLLRGKHKPTFEPHLDMGDFVIVVNASKIKLSGGKIASKTYYRHSGYPGGLKSRSFEEQLARFPERIIEDAVWGMLPNGPLGKKMLKHLKVYAGPQHPHESQVTGSERAKSAREAAAAEALLAPRKTPRLRPLSRPEFPGVLDEYPEAEAAIADAPPSAPPSPVAEPTTLPQDASSAGADAALEPEGVLEAETAPVEESAPKPRRARKPAADAAAEAEAPAEASTEEKKPRRRSAKSESEE